VYRALSECTAWPKGRLAPVILIPEHKQGPHWEIDVKKLFKEFCDGIAHDKKTADRFEWFCKHFRDDPNAATASAEEYAQKIERMRAKYGLDEPPDGAQPDPNPNPRLVQPEDFSASPSRTFLGDVKVRGD
jgi:hypothetical protein